MVEHDLAKVGVASSSLVSRSKFSNTPLNRAAFLCVRDLVSVHTTVTSSCTSVQQAEVIAWKSSRFVLLLRGLGQSLGLPLQARNNSRLRFGNRQRARLPIQSGTHAGTCVFSAFVTFAAPANRAAV